MGNLQRELAIAKELALKAGTAIMERYEAEMSIETKEDNSPLTEADMASNRIITEGLKQAFPDDGILSEESFDDRTRLRKERVWIIDPLDGTKEFIKKNGEFTVNIALAIEGMPTLGVAYLPAKDELYTAIKGRGARLLKQEAESTINVSDVKDLQEMVLVRSRSHASPALISIVEKAGFKDEKPAGSSLKGLLVASGEADAYIRLGNIHEWDICAMHAIIEEAGGIITSTEGEPLNYNKETTLIKGLVASNGKNHERILGLIPHGQA